MKGHVITLPVLFSVALAATEESARPLVLDSEEYIPVVMYMPRMLKPASVLELPTSKPNVGSDDTFKCPGKNSWPELEAKIGPDAMEVIKRENKYLTEDVIVTECTPVTEDFRCDSVRVWVNLISYVVGVPTIG